MDKRVILDGLISDKLQKYNGTVAIAICSYQDGFCDVVTLDGTKMYLRESKTRPCGLEVL